MSVEVTTPEQFVGEITGSLSSKRGIIQKQETKNNLFVVSAKVPLSELFGYTTQIRSLTSGRGTVNMEFSHYSEVPRNIVEEIAKKS